MRDLGHLSGSFRTRYRGWAVSGWRVRNRVAILKRFRESSWASSVGRHLAAPRWLCKAKS